MANILTKDSVHIARGEFFEDVIRHLSAPPKPIDETLGQVKYYFDPKPEGLICDIEYGDFYIQIDPFFAGRVWPLAYSMWQIGEKLRIAVILQAHSEDAPMADPQEFNDLWPNSTMHHMQRGTRLFLEWRFDVPGFHTNFALREEFSLGMRHLHFRVLKAVRELARKVVKPGVD